jgi:hypothetical protein
MAKQRVNTNLPLNNDGIRPDQESLLNQDHIEYDPIKIYSERADYSKESKVSEVFGPHIHSKVNMFITEYAKMYDQMLIEGNKEAAGFFETGIKKVHTQLNHLSNLKDEWMAMRGGGMRGKSTVSNITDPRWPDAFFTEKGDISITPDYQILANVPTLKAPPKLVNDIAIDWESKGDGEGRYMGAIQDMQEAGARGDKIPPFDIDYFVSNLLKEYWPQALADDWGGIYALQDEILPKMIEANGGNMDGLNTSIESFNPKIDNKLHNYYASRLKRAFDPNYGNQEKNSNSYDKYVNSGLYNEKELALIKKRLTSDASSNKSTA